MPALMKRRAALCAALVCGVAAVGNARKTASPPPVKVTRSGSAIVLDNGIVSVAFDADKSTFTARAVGRTFITSGRLGGKSDKVSVTVSGRASADNVGINRKEVRIEDRRIVLDVYWSDNVPLVAVPCGGAWFGDSLQGHTTYCYSHAVGTCRAGVHTLLVKHWRFGRICACKYTLFAVPASDRGDGSDEADGPEGEAKPSWWSSLRGILPW